jgi:DNA sulfur modification protein DndD
MIIERLAVTDFRVFQGKHEFELTPRKRWGSKRPIVLFGGLNGAGKTTTLTAVRLALYGKMSLGPATSQKKYEEFLQSCIHKSRDSVLQANHSSIELAFSYAHMGANSQYIVKRAWSLSGKKLKETLEIQRDGKTLPGLSYEQAQGFLNELIPAGVSDLFFFDGEKIAELVTDHSGNALAQSIKKLLGLDLIEKLKADLGVIVRSHDRDAADDKLTARISSLEDELAAEEKLAEKAEDDFRNLQPKLLEARANFDVANREFLSQGGAWATTREQEIARQTELQSKKSEIESRLREILASDYPLALAPRFLAKVSAQLDQESRSRESAVISRELGKFSSQLRDQLKSTLTKAQFAKAKDRIDDLTAASLSSSEQAKLIHDVSERSRASFEAHLQSATSVLKPELDQLKTELGKIGTELDQIGERIAMAPDDRTLKQTVEELNGQQSEIHKLEAKLEVHRAEAKQHIWRAIEIARKLDELYAQVERLGTDQQSVTLARSAQDALADYSKRAAQEKVQALELEFVQCFQRLARKDDISVSASIDPKTFKVTLTNLTGEEIDKNQLSAGEKQIYAIAMLEALARTSGRKLPIIIDTPLGRLDSKHRGKLIQNYFPQASHQVIILSTDTEVDEAFYSDLYKHMSHAYKLEYEPESGSTAASEGYFWRTEDIEAA